MKTTKRILALLLTFCMLVTTLCLPAFAADTEPSLTEKTATADEIKALLEGDYSLNTAGGVNNAQTVIYMGDNCYRAQATGATGTHANTYCKFLEDNGYTTRYVTSDKYVGSHLGASGARNQQYANDKYLVTVFWDSVNKVLTVTMEPLPADATLRAEYLSVFTPASTEKVCEPVAIQMGLDVDAYDGHSEGYKGAYDKGEQTAGADTPDDTSDDVYEIIPVDMRAGMSYVFRLSDGSFVIYDGGASNATAFSDDDMGKGATVLRKNMYRLLDVLNSYAVDKTDIRIAAWIITHPHTDHYKLFEQVVEEMYTPTNSHYDEYANITLERVITNYPSYEQLDNCTNAANVDGACDVLTEKSLASRRAALATCEENGAFLYKAHAGQTYYLADAEIAILYTEEIALTPSGNQGCNHKSGDQSQGNRLSIISQLTLPVNGYDVKFMITGDAEGTAIDHVNGVYSTALKSDFVQAPHHGNNDTQTSALTTFYATNVKAPYLMVPTSDDWWAGNAINEGENATLLTDSGNYTRKYSQTTGVTTFVAGDVSHEFALTVSGGSLSVKSIPLLWCRDDAMKDVVNGVDTYKFIGDMKLNTVFNSYATKAADSIANYTFDGLGNTITFGKKFSQANFTGMMGASFAGTVKNLVIDGLTWNCVGKLTNSGLMTSTGGGTYENVHFTNLTMDFTGSTRGNSSAYVGFVGRNGSAFTATNCSVSGKAYDSAHGDDFAAATAITMPVRLGGFLGCVHTENADVTLTNCVSNLQIIDRDTNNNAAKHGGFIGSVEAAANVTLNKCINNGTIASSGRTGGFIGSIQAAATITFNDCVNNGDMPCNRNAGGFLGYDQGPTTGGSITFNRCVNNGDVTGNTHHAGGLVATIAGTTAIKYTVDACVNNGNISATQGAGGFFGSGATTGVDIILVKNSLNMGDISTIVAEGETSKGGAIFGNTAACATEGSYAITMENNANMGTVYSMFGNGNKEHAIRNGLNSNMLSEAAVGITDAPVQTNVGAGIRIVNDDKGTGLRFKVTMDATSYADLQKMAEKYGAENVMFGALIVPTDYIDAANGIFTKDTVKNARDMYATVDKLTGENDGSAFYYASLVNLYENHYNTEYTCISYYSFRFNANAEWITVYGDAVTKTISDVADAFLADQTVDFSRYTPEQLALVNAYAAAND